MDLRKKAIQAIGCLGDKILESTLETLYSFLSVPEFRFEIYSSLLTLGKGGGVDGLLMCFSGDADKRFATLDKLKEVMEAMEG